MTRPGKRLGERLVEEGLVSPEQLEEALETQVIHGGRLGTNLVEHGFLSEVDLARTLGQIHQLPFASGAMVPDPAALALADPRFCDEHELLPMRVDATRLTVVVLGPAPIDALDTLAFTAGKRVVPVVIPEFRMSQLLRKHCKAFRPMRPIDVHELRPSTRGAPAGPRPADVSDLIDESDFAKIYADAVAGDQAGRREPPTAAPAPLPGGAGVEPPRPPLAFADAQAALKLSVSREEIARTVLRFAVGKFKRALLLSVRGDLLTGWQGPGEGVEARAVHRIGVSLREDNTFRLVRSLRSHFVGPMKRTPAMEVFYQLLGGGQPTTAVVLPLLVRGRPVHLLYLDQGPDRVTPPDVGELMILSQSVTRSYELLVRARQAARATTGG